MSHLSIERLASLSDEAPNAAELAHLAGCADCARERAAYASLAALASSETSRIGEPLTNWEYLKPALIADGVIDSGGIPHVGVKPIGRGWLQAAAAVLLAAGGVVGGRLSAHASAFPARDRSVATSAASNDSTPRFNSADEARAAQSQAQYMYQASTAFLAQQDTTSRQVDSPASMRTRLAALDRTRQVLGEALQKAPYDPVINGYYLSTVGQQEATVRRLSTLMPVSMGISSY